MQSLLRSQGSGWVGLAAAAGMLASVLVLSGCPGTLGPAFKNGETGGSTGTGGGNPTGGSTGTGGTGTGGTSANCTGGNDGATIVTMQCAQAFCHIPGAQNDAFAGGLDLTVDANIGSRLVGVMSVGTDSNGSLCMGNTEPYLKSGSNPATGLLIDKISMSQPPCGFQMPAGGLPLTAIQQSCLIQWATTLTSP
jgi:hypothetical protein